MGSKEHQLRLEALSLALQHLDGKNVHSSEVLAAADDFYQFLATPPLRTVPPFDLRKPKDTQ